MLAVSSIVPYNHKTRPKLAVRRSVNCLLLIGADTRGRFIVGVPKRGEMERGRLLTRVPTGHEDQVGTNGRLKERPKEW